MAWKSRLLRSVNQDGARVQLLEAIDESSVLIVQDWAKKYLPRKYRQRQTDWFGKRGIPWQEQDKNILANVFATRDHLDVKIAQHRSGSISSIQLAPSRLASSYQKYSIQNSIDTQTMLYMQDMDPGRAKYCTSQRKVTFRKCRSRMKRPVAEHGSKTQEN